MADRLKKFVYYYNGIITQGERVIGHSLVTVV